jgi:thiosulfate/3-mercaptopyruvate sulfurtransferase
MKKCHKCGKCDKRCYSSVISTSEARKLQKKGNLVILDVQNSPPATPKLSYEIAHLEGALFVDWRKDLTDTNNLPLYELPTKAQFEDLCERLGITQESHVLCYDNFNNRLAMRTVFVFYYFGFKNISIIEGGIELWKKDGYPVTKVVPIVTRSKFKVKDENKSLVVLYDDIYNADKNNALVVDARPTSQYLGISKGSLVHTGQPVARYGHIGIPSELKDDLLINATSSPWADNLVGPDNLLIKPSKELYKMYMDRGIISKKNKYVYTTCNEGIHAVTDWFVLETILCQDNVKVYEGSFGEWAMLSGKPSIAFDPPK